MGQLVFLFLFFLSLCQVSLAAEISDSVVKIQSAATGISAAVRKGSAILVNFEGSQWILTSDHVIYHSNKNFKHAITLSSGKTIPVQFLTADAGKGFAVLEPLEPVPKELFHIVSASAVLAQEITLIGYPAESSEAVTSVGSFSADSLVPSNLFPELLKLIEVRNTYAEFGMSGGGAFCNGALVGILSHINQDNTALNVLAVPLADIVPTLKSFDPVRKVFPGIHLVQDPAQQLSEFPSFRTGSLYVTFIAPFGADAAKGVEVIPTKSSSTENLYASPRMLEAQNFFKERPTERLRFVGFREANTWSNAGGSGQSFIANLRALADPRLEPLWYIEGYDRQLPLDEASALAAQVSRGLPGASGAPILRSKFFDIANLTDCQKNSGEMDKSICYHAGPWRIIKPKDLKGFLQDPALQSEWQYLDKNHPSLNVQKSLSRLITIFADLTL